jgi:hypothetical protein
VVPGALVDGGGTADPSVFRICRIRMERELKTTMLMNIVRGWLIFPKGLLGGLGGAIGMWILVLCFSAWRLSVAKRRLGIQGLGAVAGGWTYLAHSPMVVVLITVAFGLGFYLSTRP